MTRARQRSGEPGGAEGRPGSRARTGEGARVSVLVETPIGPLVVSAEGSVVTEVLLPDRGSSLRGSQGSPAATTARRTMPGATPDVLQTAARQLGEYFAGTRRRFTVPLAATGTPFQVAVWDALDDIPYGETVTYGELAVSVGRPGAFRAVGQANGANPLPIFHPCHRVVAAGGRLGGYGGGLGMKRQLLALEGSPLAAAR